MNANRLNTDILFVYEYKKKIRFRNVIFKVFLFYSYRHIIYYINMNVQHYPTQKCVIV